MANMDTRLKYAIAFGISMCLIAYAALYPDFATFLISMPFLLVAPILVLIAMPRYSAVRQNREIERELPGALFHASSLSSFMMLEDVLKTLAESGYGRLSCEFGKAHNEIRKGAGVEEALNRMAQRNRSAMLQRSLNLIVLGCKTGAEISDALREVAEDISESASVVKERATGFTVQKYTLLLAGGIIVPLILGSMISLVQSLDLGALSEFGFGPDPATRDLVFNNAVLGNHIYIAVYAVMASVFIAYQENRIERALFYIAVLLPCSLFLFNLAQNITIFGFL
jgi:pilus assembly protein TadC